MTHEQHRLCIVISKFFIKRNFQLQGRGFFDNLLLMISLSPSCKPKHICYVKFSNKFLNRFVWIHFPITFLFWKNLNSCSQYKEFWNFPGYLQCAKSSEARTLCSLASSTKIGSKLLYDSIICKPNVFISTIYNRVTFNSFQSACTSFV